MEEKQPPKQYLDEEHSKEECKWGMFLHLSQLANFVIPIAGLVAPIVIWQIKKDEYPVIDAHGKNAVNWLISSAIYAVVGMLLMLVFVGIFVLLALVACGVVFPIIAGIKANNGEVWKYPLTISFLK
jgi:uncharacterized Tic20 family protein